MARVVGTLGLSLPLLLALVALAGHPASAQGPNCSADETRRGPLHDNDVFRRFHATSCWIEGDFIDDYRYDDVTDPNHGPTIGELRNSSQGAGARRRNVWCPIITDAELRLGETSYQEIAATIIDDHWDSVDNVALVSHCVSDPTSMITECDEMVWHGTGANGSTGAGYLETDCINKQGPAPLNVPIKPRGAAKYMDYYVLLAISLPMESLTRFLGYEVSRCSTPSCQVIPISGDPPKED